MSNEGHNIEIGTLTGSGTLIGDGQWILGGNDANFYLSTEIGVTSARTDPYGTTIPVSASKLTKTGTGKMTMMTLGKLNAVLTVEKGTVSFNEAKLETYVNGQNMTTVKDGGRIVGQGKMQTVQLQSGSEMIPCGSYINETTPGTIKTTALLNAMEGSVVNFLFNNNKQSTLQPMMLTMNGTVKVTLLNGYTPQEGDEFTLWTTTSTYKGTPTFQLPQLPAGMAWDTSQVAQKTGVLKVVAAEVVKGDVNGDNVVDVADIAAILGVMAGTAENYRTTADVNDDGQVDVADIAAVLNRMAELARLAQSESNDK